MFNVIDTKHSRVVRRYAATRLAEASYLVCELNRREPGRYAVRVIRPTTGRSAEPGRAGVVLA